MKVRHTIQCSLGALASALLFPAVASAQDVPQQEEVVSGGVEEIVVTAQKRSENAQNVPIAISAVSAASMEAKGLTSVVDLAGSAPNVSLNVGGGFSGSSSVLISYIRGIGQNDFAFNLDPGVGVYVDGVYLARNIGANSDLLDLDRVEVLKGPQGTLFGRNTIGGAINIVTRDPSDHFGYKGEITTGRFNRIDVRGSVDVPLIPNVMLANFSFATKNRDGYQHRVPFPGFDGNYVSDVGKFAITDNRTPSKTSGNQNQDVFRAKILVKPADGLKITLAGDYANVDEEATPQTLLDVNSGPRAGNPSVAFLYNTCINTPASVLASIPAEVAPLNAICNSAIGNPTSPYGVMPPLGGVNVDANSTNNRITYDNRFITGNPDISYAGGANYSRIKNWGLSGAIEYDLAANMTVKSITAFRDLDARFGVDIGGAPFAALQTTFRTKERQFSEELQIVGNAFAERWKYVFGAYYFHEYGNHTDRVPFIGGLVQVRADDQPFDTKAFALFTHNNIEIIPDRLGLTLGARYTNEKKFFQSEQKEENILALKAGIPPFFFPDPNDLTYIFPREPVRQKFNNFSYRIGAEYKFSRDVMAYASFANGFKSGGFTTRVTAPLPPTFNADDSITPAVAPTFKPEKANTYEIGFKSTFADRAVRLNGAVFYTDYKDLQLTVQQLTTPVFVNGGDARIKGFELEAQVVPAAGLSMDFSVGYTDAKYTRVAPGVIGITTASRFVNTPEWQLHGGISYRADFGSFQLTPRADVSYSSSMALDPENTALLIRPDVTTVDTSVTLNPGSDRVEVQFGIKNLFDKRYLVSGYVNDLAITTGMYSRPREWFLTLRVKN